MLLVGARLLLMLLAGRCRGSEPVLSGALALLVAGALLLPSTFVSCRANPAAGAIGLAVVLLFAHSGSGSALYSCRGGSSGASDESHAPIGAWRMASTPMTSVQKLHKKGRSGNRDGAIVVESKHHPLR